MQVDLLIQLNLNVNSSLSPVYGNVTTNLCINSVFVNFKHFSPFIFHSEDRVKFSLVKTISLKLSE